MPKIGIIGGSGLDDPKLLQNCEEKQVSTPYGLPSSTLTIGKLNEIDIKPGWRVDEVEVNW